MLLVGQCRGHDANFRKTPESQRGYSMARWLRMLIVVGCVMFRKMGWLQVTTGCGSGDRWRRRNHHISGWSRPLSQPPRIGWRLHGWANSLSLLLRPISVV